MQVKRTFLLAAAAACLLAAPAAVRSSDAAEGDGDAGEGDADETKEVRKSAAEDSIEVGKPFQIVQMGASVNDLVQAAALAAYEALR